LSLHYFYKLVRIVARDISSSWNRHDPRDNLFIPLSNGDLVSWFYGVR
jgi:hypothetical protein